MQSTALCPSCGRHVGPYEACPYCGARLEPRVSVRALRYGSLLVAVAGLAVLWFFSLRSPVPEVKIGQVQATMNFAYVRVSGQVIRSPSYDADSSYLNFWIQDDTGEMMVSSYRGVTQDLLAAGKRPDVGDRATLEGTLRLREETPSLVLTSAETVRLARAEPAPYSIGDITPADALQPVIIRGLVRQVETPYTGLTLLTVRDQTGVIDVAVSEWATAILDGASSELSRIQPGDPVEVTGAVTLYGDTPQVALTAWGRLARLSETMDIAPLVKAADLAAGRVGGMARVEGEVAQVKPFSAGVKLTVDDGTGRVVVLVWNDIYSGLADREKIVEGAIVSAQGELSLYRGEMELVAESPADVALLARSLAEPPPRPPATLRPTLMSKATSTPVPAPTFTPASPSPTLTSPSPTPTWASPSPTPRSASTPSPTPKPTSPPLPAAVAIKTITLETVGQVVTLRGSVVDVTSTSAGFKFWLDDGTGRVDLFLTNGVYGHVAGRAGLHIGAQVAATGEVKEYKGALEVVPPLGENVTVVTPAAGPPAALRPIASIGEADQAHFVAIQGVILAREPLKGGVKLRVHDDSGDIDVVLWDNVLAYVAGAERLVEGASLSVIGKISFYRGAPQLVPQLGYDVKIM